MQFLFTYNQCLNCVKIYNNFSGYRKPQIFKMITVQLDSQALANISFGTLARSQVTAAFESSSVFGFLA